MFTYHMNICGVKYATPSGMLLEEVGLLPLQSAVWWWRTLEFWNKVAAGPVESSCHMILLDNLDDAFAVGSGVKNISGSIATYLQTIGQTMPHDRGVIPILEVGTIVKALRQQLGGTHGYALHCPRAAPTVGVVACTHHHWFRPFSQHRRYCQRPVSGKHKQRFSTG